MLKYVPYIMYLLPECMSFPVLCILNRQNLQPQRYCRGLPVRKNLTAKNVKICSLYNVLVAGMYEFSGALHSESSKFAAAAVLQGTSRSEKPDCEKC